MIKIAKLIKYKDILLNNMLFNVNEFDDGIITIMELDKEINAEYKNGKLYGKGSKMYRNEILEVIKQFKRL